MNLENQKMPEFIENPIFALTKAGNLDAIKAIYSEKIFFEVKDSRGNTPLMLAAYYGHLDLVKYYISLGSNLNFVDRSGNSILMGACFKGHTAVAEQLILAGANLDFKNPKGLSAVDFAVMFGRLDTVKMLERHSRQKATRLKSWLKFLIPFRLNGKLID